MVGCAKQEDPAVVGKTVQKSQQAETVTSEADYDAVFAATTKMLDEGTHLVITKVKGGYVFTVESGTISAARIPVCPWPTGLQ